MLKRTGLMKRRIRLFLPVAGVVMLAGAAIAQNGGKPASIVMASVFGSKCASCHGASLQGGGAPALKGAAFMTKWGDAGEAALADYIARSMPPGAAGSVDPVMAQQLASYILQQNSDGGKSAEESAAPAAPKVEDDVSRAAQAQLKAVADKIGPVTDAMLQAVPKDDWLAWRGSSSSLGFSSLAQINSGNVGKLRLVWSKTLGAGGNGIAPIAHDGVLFLNGGGKISAIDAGSGDTIWERDAKVAPRGVSQPRGVAIYGDALYAATVDNHVMALDARTGKQLWEQVIGDQSTISAAPLVAKGKVFQGTAVCFGKGMRCFMTALDAKTGKELWRFDTIPADGAPGSESWGGAPASERGGGGVWAGPSYDYARDQLIFGTGNSYAVDTMLKKDPRHPVPALYTNTTLKLDARTGKPAWYYQHVAGDVWDEDWAFERMIANNPRGDGKPVVMTMGKLGILDALDLKTGKYLWSYDFGIQDIVKNIDPRTGVKTIDTDKIPVEGRVISACPFAGGVRNWPSTAYDPDNGLLFLPAMDTCMEVAIDKTLVEQSAWKVKARPGSGNKFGRLAAVDLRTGKTLWDVARRSPGASAVLATAGGLVFEGSRDRWFRALDSKTGQTLWQVRLSDTPNSFPITYTAGGKQYIAVVTGAGTYFDGFVSHLTPEIEPSLGRPALWVFALENPNGAN